MPPISPNKSVGEKDDDQGSIMSALDLVMGKYSNEVILYSLPALYI